MLSRSLSACESSSGPLLDLTQDPCEVAPQLLGAVIRTDVAIRITEVEAYRGELDPGSHAYRGKTKRNASMFGPPGHLYVYYIYGMHWSANIVCWPEDRAGGVLLRAGEVIENHELARSRRVAAKTDRDLARGPARLAQALGIDGGWNGTPVSQDGSGSFVLEPTSIPAPWTNGPRVGVSGPGGTDDYPWRYWIPGDRNVSAYRPGKF